MYIDTTRLAAATATLEKAEIDIEVCAGELDEDGPKLDRYLLVERNRLDTPLYYITSHTSPEAAGAYHWGQEYCADYEIRLLVDLDTGDRYAVEQRFIARKLATVTEGGGQ